MENPNIVGKLIYFDQIASMLHCIIENIRSGNKKTVDKISTPMRKAVQRTSSATSVVNHPEHGSIGKIIKSCDPYHDKTCRWTHEVPK